MVERVQMPGTERAQEIAVKALGYLAQDSEQLSRFLALTGMGPSDLRAAASDPGFLAGVLAHFTAHEPSLIAFCEACDLDPAEVAQAGEKLGGGNPWLSA